MKKILKVRKALATVLLTAGLLAATVVAPVPAAYAGPANKANKTNSSKAKAKSNSSQSSGKSKSSKRGGKSGQASSSKKTGKSGQTKPETSADVRRRQESTAREIKLTEQQIRENEAAVKRSLGELGKLEGDIDVSKKKVAAASAKVTALQTEIGKLETQIAHDEQSLAKLRAEYLKAVKVMRGKRKEKSALAFLFSSKNFNEALRRMRYLRQFSAWREKQTRDIDARVTRLKTRTAQLQQTKQMHDRELAVEVRERDNLQSQFARQDAIVADLKKNGQALKSHLAKKQAEANALKGRIASLIAEEQRKAEAEQAAKARAEAERLAKAEADRKAREEADRHAREETARLAREKAEREKDLTAQNQAKEQKAKEQKAKEQKAKEQKTKTQDKKQTAQATPKPDNNAGKAAGGEVSYAEARKRKPKNTAPAPSGSGTASVPAPKKVESASAVASSGSSFESMRGSLPRPVSGSFKVTARFGQQSLPDMPGVTYDNPGIDAEVASGATAQAVYAGKVSGVYMIPGYSTVVIVNHGTYYTVYGNLSAANVKVGDAVKQGQALGRVAPDEDDPSHSSIHFEVWKNRDKQDPLKWIR